MLFGTKKDRKVKIILITGYLGAGKTTLLNHILHNQQGIRAAVMVNDIGEVNVDAQLIRKGGFSEVDDTLFSLTNGCICCTLAPDLERQLTQIADSGNFDYVIIEASGICEPIPIAMTISNFCDQRKAQARGRRATLELDNIVAVVDAARMFDEFSGGQALLDEKAAEAEEEGDDEEEEENIESLLIQQIEFCTTLVLNKADLVTPEQMDELRAIVRSLQKEAVIVEATNCELPMSELLDTGRFDFERAYASAAWLDAMEHPEEHEDPEVLEYDIATFVYKRRRPFDMDRFVGYVQTWPSNVIRVKGMFWAADDYDMCYVFETAGRQARLAENGYFVASAPDDERRQILAANPQIAEDWDPEVGDRQNNLVFIGRHMDVEGLIAGLDACLV